MADLAFETPWFKIETWQLPESGEPFYRICQPEGVVVVPLTRDRRFVLIRQYRPALERFTLEFPAGGLSGAETPEEAARRELYEETGYRAEILRLACAGTLRLERENTLNHFFIAGNVDYDPAFVSCESIETRLATKEELRLLALEGSFDHLAALPALLMASWRFGLEW